MDQLITHVSNKTYAYGAIRAENPKSFYYHICLKARMKNGENGKSVNTKFDKTHGSQTFLCVTPLNKNAFQKQTVVLKTKENHVESKPVTSQTSHTKQTGTHQNTNVISPGMYRVVTQQESQTNKSKNVLSSTGMNATSSVKRPKSRDSHVKTSVLDDNVLDVAAAKASKRKLLLCVSCNKSVLKSFVMIHVVLKHKLNVRSNARKTFSVNSRIPKSSETTFVAPKTRFSEKATQSKTLDTTSVASKSKIDEASASKVRDKFRIVLWVVDKVVVSKEHMTGDRALLRNFVEKFMGTVRFGNDNFAAITGYGMTSYDLCVPMRVASVPMERSDIRVIVDGGLSRDTWVDFLRLKDETPEISRNSLAQAQLHYKGKVCKDRTDNRHEFKNATLKAHYENLVLCNNYSIALSHLSKMEY
ncbi:hypothetical protein Tco_1352511 [Tanacetum coccineum]